MLIACLTDRHLPPILLSPARPAPPRPAPPRPAPPCAGSTVDAIHGMRRTINVLLESSIAGKEYDKVGGC